MRRCSCGVSSFRSAKIFADSSNQLVHAKGLLDARSAGFAQQPARFLVDRIASDENDSSQQLWPVRRHLSIQ